MYYYAYEYLRHGPEEPLYEPAVMGSAVMEGLRQGGRLQRQRGGWSVFPEYVTLNKQRQHTSWKQANEQCDAVGGGPYNSDGGR